jgi:hypothetical protein
MAKKIRSTSSISTTTSKKNTTAQEFNPDYTHILKDLKRIGIMAVSFVAILIVLSFILN